MTSGYLRFYRSTAHPLLSLAIPLLFLLTLDQLLKTLLPPLQVCSPLIVFILLLTTALEEGIAGNILFKERASFTARLRELVLLLLVFFLALLAVNRIPIREIGLLRLDLSYPLALALLQWLFSQSIHGKLREREILLSGLLHRKEGALRHALRDASYQSGIVVREMRSIKRTAASFQMVVVILLALALVRGGGLSPYAVILVAVHTIGGFLFSSLINLLEENQQLLAEGILISTRLEGRRLLFILSFLALALSLVLLLSRNASLLPLSYLLALLEKLAGLFRVELEPRQVRGIIRIFQEQRRFLQMYRPPTAAPVNPALFQLVTIITELLRRLLRTLIGIALYFFLVAPLFSDYFLKRLGRLGPWKRLWRKLRSLRLFWRRLWYRLLRRLRAPWSGDRARAREKAENPLQKLAEQGRSPKRGFRKRVQMGRVLRAFVGLIKWGQERGIDYFPWNTPQEYAVRLERAVPGIHRSLGYIVEIFEEAIFSTHLLARRTINRYFRAIKKVKAGHGALLEPSGKQQPAGPQKVNSAHGA